MFENYDPDLSLSEAARRLGASRGHVRTLVMQGRLKAHDVRLGIGNVPRWCIRASEVQRFQRENSH